MLDINFQPPSLHGLDFAKPEDVREGFTQLSEALADALRMVREQANNPQYIRVDGGRTLAEVMRMDRAKPGDVMMTVSQRVNALKRDGWVLCDGRNGTPKSVGALVLGAAVADNPGTSVVAPGSAFTGQPKEDTSTDVGDSPVIVLDGACIPSVAMAADHKHPMPHHHLIELASGTTSFTVVFLMKL